jgi:hypothetical protein
LWRIKKGFNQQKGINRKSIDKYRRNKKEINSMEFTKEFTLKDIMQFAHDLEEMRKGLDMVKELLGDSEIRTIKKE